MFLPRSLLLLASASGLCFTACEPAPKTTSPAVNLPPMLLFTADRLHDLAHPTTEETHTLRAGLLAQADAVLATKKTYAVTCNDFVPPSGDKRDYYSTGPYWWPNPDTPDGLPYVRRDGEFNPTRDLVSDRAPLRAMIADVQTMAFAYAITGNAPYAEWGHELVRVWFLDEATGMRPNLKHAQAIPGITEGRGTGIIDTHPFAELIDPLHILEASPTFPEEDVEALRGWFATYLDWLLTSENGRDEAGSINNHGTAYDLQAVALMAYLGNTEQIETYFADVVSARIAQQIMPDGTQPHELKRTRTWSYSTENLEHFVKLARLGQRAAAVDLFAYQATNGASLSQALAYLLPAVRDPSHWPHEQATAWQQYFINAVLAIANDAYPEMDLPDRRVYLTEAPNQLEAFLLEAK